MKKQGFFYLNSALLALFFLLTACTTTTTNTQQGKASPSMTQTNVKTSKGNINTPGASTNNITLPPQPTLPPSPTIPIVQPTPSPITQSTPSPVPTSTDTNGGGNGPSISQPAQAVLTLINQERAGAGLPALTMSNALIQSAHLHNLAMQAADQLSHQLPGEAALGTRITAQGITWTMVAENIGYGFGDATQTAISLNQSMFAEKPPDDGHRLNILSSNTLVGIDVIVNAKNAQVWLTEDFARPA